MEENISFDYSITLEPFLSTNSAADWMKATLFSWVEHRSLHVVSVPPMSLNG
jgi:hypothetical protein